MPHPLLIVSQSDYLMVVDTNSNTEWQTVQIQINSWQLKIRWLLKKPTDQDLNCLQRQRISRFSRTRVNSLFPCCFSVPLLLFICMLHCRYFSVLKLAVFIPILWWQFKATRDHSVLWSFFPNPCMFKHGDWPNSLTHFMLKYLNFMVAHNKRSLPNIPSKKLLDISDMILVTHLIYGTTWGWLLDLFSKMIAISAYPAEPCESHWVVDTLKVVSYICRDYSEA